MNKRIEISVNQEDVQNIIDCYEKDIEYIKQLEAKVNQLETNRDDAIEYIEKNELNGNKISEMLCGSEIVALLEILERGKE